jgi:hypothetical protein
MPSKVKDGQVEPSVQPNLIDISALSASATGLLRQLLASKAGKETIKDDAYVGESAHAKE